MIDKREVRIFDLKYDQKFIEKFSLGAVEILRKGFLTNDDYVKKFEHNFSSYNSSKYCVAVNNGTSAIELSLRAIGIKNCNVVIPTNTFIATALAVENAGGKVILSDIEDEYFGICPYSLEKIFEANEVKVCVVVHIGGHISPKLLEVIEVCKKYNVELIEDCAHGLGAKLTNKHAGNFGRFGCFSFFTTKNLAMGEGGAVVCDNEDDYKKLISLRQFGKDENNPISHIEKGSNFKLNEFCALLGVLDLERLPERIQRRREISDIYKNFLDQKKYKVIFDDNLSFGSYYKQIVIPLVISREKIEQRCREYNIALTGGVYYIPVHKQPSFKNESQFFDNANWFCSKHICPPCYPELTDEQVKYVCNVLNSIHE